MRRVTNWKPLKNSRISRETSEMDIYLTNSTGHIMMVKRGINSRTLTQKIAITLGTGSVAAFITGSNVPGERTVHTPTHLTTKPFVWTRDWRRTPKKGRFAICNRIPPSLNPTKHFTELKDQREACVRPPSPMPHRARLHRRIPQTVLPWGEHKLRMRRGSPNP